MRLKDKVAIVTGAASGIGKATAILFAEHGAKVVIADIDEDGANETVASIQDAGNQTIYVQTDVTISDNTERMVQETLNTYGKLDILVSSAGIAMRLPVGDLPEEDWHRCLNVNLTGVYLCAKAAIPAMQKNGGGSIINLSSIYGIVGADVRAAYVASKGGVTNLTRGMALDYAEDNIRVNCLCPGFVENPVSRRCHQNASRISDARRQASDASARTARRDCLRCPIPRLPTKPLSSTGIALPIDGGYTAG